MKWPLVFALFFLACQKSPYYDLTVATSVKGQKISAGMVMNGFPILVGALGSDSGITWLMRNRSIPDTVQVSWVHTLFTDTACLGDDWAIGKCKTDTASYREYNIPFEIKSKLPPITAEQKYHIKFMIHDKGQVSLRVAVHGIHETWYTDGCSVAQ